MRLALGTVGEHPRSPLTIAVAQPRCVPYDVAANAVAHATCVRRARARVVVFPELSLTGYHFDAAVLHPDDDALAPLMQACAEAGTLALVGAPARALAPAQGARSENRTIAMWAVDGDGARAVYHKMWLGSAEESHFVPGPEPRVLTVDGWRVGLAICRDTGIENHIGATTALGIDVYAAGVLETAADAHVQTERAARATAEHGVWVAVAAFAGTTGEGYDRTSGGSAIWRPDGTMEAAAGADPGEVAVATLL